MKRYHVTSTSIVSVGYNSDNHILEIEYPSGSVYDYYEVPPNEYANLLHAQSKGAYLNTYIKPVYEYRQVR